MAKMTTAEFIARAKEVHGNKYDYSKTEYVNPKTKVTITCPVHGDFIMLPYNHLKGQNCPLCAKGIAAGKSRKTTEDFIEEARKVHGDKYDYSKVVYENSHAKVCIICHEKDEFGNEHGEFWQSPIKHIKGQGCTKCSQPKKGMDFNTFLAKAKEIHGDKYDYSKVNWSGITNIQKQKICIICTKHGEFWQTPSSHLSSQGCPKCIGWYKTTEDFIEEARKVHGDKYDYSKVVYENSHVKVCIICHEKDEFGNEHGEFWQTPANHLYGQGCIKCGGRNKMTTEDFIAKARIVHGDKYDYSKVVYEKASKKVCIICPEHGEFWQTPNGHLGGRACPKCTRENYGLTTEEFITKAKEIHGDKYDYSKTVVNKACDKVCIICPEHGEFWQAPYLHLSNQGCPKCLGKNKTTEDFIEEARKVHGDKYDYSKVVYVNNKTKVTIICPVHGEFTQTPSDHLSGYGCPNCHGYRKPFKFKLINEFANEFNFRAFLANNDVNIVLLILGSLCELEPKYAPLERDIQRALANANNTDPIEALEQKYSTESESDSEGTAAEEETTVPETPQPTTTIDLDNDNDVYAALAAATEENNEEQTEHSIEDVIRNDEQEIQVINRIEHMLTPEIRLKIMKKYLNDKRRAWMMSRENSK